MSRALAACALALTAICSACTEPSAASHVGAYVLVSYQGNPPPTRLAPDVFVLSGSITLQRNSRWMSTDDDSVTTTAQRVTETAGGMWSVRGTVLSLTDTTTAGAGRTFVATITRQAIEFPEIPSRYERQ